MKDFKMNLDLNTTAFKEAINLIASISGEVFNNINTQKENAFKIDDELKRNFRKEIETMFSASGLNYSSVVEESIKSKVRFDDIKNIIQSKSENLQLLTTYKEDVFEKIIDEMYSKKTDEKQKGIYFNIMNELSLTESSGLLADIDERMTNLLNKRMFAKDFEDIQKINQEIQLLKAGKKSLEYNFTSIDELDLLSKKYAVEKKLNQLKGDNSKLYVEEILTELNALQSQVKTEEEQVKFLTLKNNLLRETELFRAGEYNVAPLKEDLNELDKGLKNTDWYDVQKAALNTISQNIDELVTKSWERSFGEANSFLEQFLLNVSKALLNLAAESAAKGLFNSFTSNNNGDNGNFLGSIISFLGGFIPFLGSGGIVTKPTLSVIGEKGAEAVIPLEKLSSNISIEGVLEKYLKRIDEWQRDIVFKQRGEDLLAAQETAEKINERYSY